MSQPGIGVWAVGLAALTAGLLSTASFAVAAQPDFGTRSPRTCPTVRSLPNPTQAAALVQCGLEHKGDRDVVLYENVQVQMGGAQAYSFKAHSTLSEIDTGSKVYPIRGSMTYYSCYNAVANHSEGHNCTTNARPKSTGFCWKTTFGDWKCWMQDYDNVTTGMRMDAPPPKS